MSKDQNVVLDEDLLDVEEENEPKTGLAKIFDYDTKFQWTNIDRFSDFWMGVIAGVVVQGAIMLVVVLL